MLGSLARLYAQGLDPNWKAVVTPARAGRAAIPTYPFQRKRYYRAPIVDAGRHAPAAGAASGGHPYLGQRIHSRLLPKGAALHQALFTAENPAFLVEHQIFGKIISPAAAHLSMAFAAAGGGASLEDVSFTAPLVVDAGAARIVQLAIESDGVGYSLASQPVDKPGDVWTVHSAGRIAAPATAPAALDLAAIRAFLDKHGSEPFLIFGFTYLVWLHLYEVARDNGLDLSNGILIHSGGWKKLIDQAVSPAEFRSRLAGVGLTRSHNFYGMVEQIGTIFLEGPSGVNFQKLPS